MHSWLMHTYIIQAGRHPYIGYTHAQAHAHVHTNIHTHTHAHTIMHAPLP